MPSNNTPSRWPSTMVARDGVKTNRGEKSAGPRCRTRCNYAQPRTRVARSRRVARPTLFLARILDVDKLVKLDVGEFAVALLDTADVHGLHDVSSLGIDRDCSARAHPLHALEHGHRFVAVDLATEFARNLVDRGHRVIARRR